MLEDNRLRALLLYCRDEWSNEMKNQFTENYIKYDEMLGIISTMSVEDVMRENELAALEDRKAFKGLIGK